MCLRRYHVAVTEPCQSNTCTGLLIETTEVKHPRGVAENLLHWSFHEYAHIPNRIRVVGGLRACMNQVLEAAQDATVKAMQC
jgi:hypothetical protein